MIFSLRTMMKLRLAVIEVYLNLIQDLKKVSKNTQNLVNLEIELLEERKNFQLILNNFELETYRFYKL